MTVAELIAELLKMPPDAKVMCFDRYVPTTPKPARRDGKVYL